MPQGLIKRTDITIIVPMPRRSPDPALARGLTAQEAARRIGVGVAKFYALRREAPELAGYTIPSLTGTKPRRRFDIADVDAFIERLKSESKAS